MIPRVRRRFVVREYLAPETILTRHKKTGYGHAVDWWSFGTLTFEMLTGWPPFYHKNIKTMCEKILKAPLVFPERPVVSKEAKDMIRRLLVRDPTKRITSEELKKHAFFKSIDWDKLERKEVTPPFVPMCSSSDDVRYFDVAFTREVPRLPSGRPLLHQRMNDNFTFEGADDSMGDDTAATIGRLGLREFRHGLGSVLICCCCIYGVFVSRRKTCAP